MTSRISKMPANDGYRVALVIVALALSAGLATVLTQEDEGGSDRPVDITHNVLNADAPIAGAVFGSGTPVKPGQVICTTPTQNTANVDTDCEKTGPSNETSIAVNPTNGNNIIGGANDYHPTTGNRWFAATVNPSFPFATTFLGDYSNIAATPTGGIVAYWTDLRLQACFAGACRKGQDAFFAAAP